MNMTEADLMLLEEYLDGELSAADARALEERSLREPALASELNRLRADRQIRAQAWRAMEGDEAAVTAVAGRVIANIERRESFTFLLRGLRIGAAAAACIVLGLTVGFFARSANPAHPDSPEALVPPSSDQTALPETVAAAHLPSAAQGYDVNLKDEAGKVVAVQHFSNLDQARQFVQDVGQWQQHQEQMHNGNVTFVADQY
jgi:anti-sigma factor RsiW